MAKNGKDWDAIREAWEGGAPWSKLKKMASKGAISNHANGFNGDEPWDAAKRKANGGNGNGKKRKPVNSEQRTAVNSEQGGVRPAARAPVLPDPDLVDDHFQSAEILQETVTQLEGFAKFGRSVAKMAEGLVVVVQKNMWVKQSDGSMKLKDGADMSEARQAAGLLEQLAKAGDKGISIYRRSRGLYDKQKLEHSGRIEGARSDDTIATYLGFALQGALRGASPVPEGVPGGPGQAEDLDCEQEDREVIPDSN